MSAHEQKRRVGSPGVFITLGTYFILYSKAPIAEKQKRTHKFEISTIALTDKTDVENAFFS